MRILRTILVLILGFTIGVLSTIVGIVGGGYYVVSKYTPERVEDTIQNFSPGFAFPENMPQNLMNMTILEIVQELIGIASSLDTMSLNDLQDRLGYQLPLKLGNGQDISFLFSPVMDIPILSIPSNMNLVVDSLTMDSLVLLGVLDDESLPSLPIFMDPESRNMPIMKLFSNLDSFKISDVISLYTGDYYPDANGNYIMLSGEYIVYNPEQASHKDKTRYKECYIPHDEGEYVKVDGEYISYHPDEHSGNIRYTTKMIPHFNGDKIIINDVFILYDPYIPYHNDYPRYMLPERSPDILISLGNSYINNVPEDDPDGLTISETINILQVKDIIDIDGGSLILLALQDAYIGNSAPESDPDGKTIPETVNTLQIKDVIEIFEEDLYDGEELIQPKSNKVLIALQDAYIGRNPPEGGLSLDETINSLQIEDIMEIQDKYIYDSNGQLIQDSSTAFLIAVKKAYIGNNPPEGESDLNDTINTLKISDIITIYHGGEYVVSQIGDLVADGFIAYDEMNSDHTLRIRFVFDSETDRYISDPEGGWVLNYIDYDALEHDGLTRYHKTPASSKILVALQNAYLNEPAPEGEKTINDTIETLTLHDILNVYEQDHYYSHEHGDYVLDYVTYNPDNVYHEHLQRYSYDGAEYFEDPIGAYVLYYTDYSPLSHSGYERFNLNHKSSLVLIALKDTRINDMNADITSLTLRDIQVIYDGYEFYVNNNGNYIQDGYISYDSDNPYHKHLQRYSQDGAEYEEDNDGDYVPNIRPSMAGEEDIYPRYDLRNPSSKLIVSLSDTPIEEIGDKLDQLTIGEMIDINSSSPKIMQFFSSATLLTLESSVQDIQLKDVVDIYYKDIYELDGEGYFVLDGEDYIKYDSSLHIGWDRYTRIISISEDDMVYSYSEEGDFVLLTVDPDSYESYNESDSTHNGLPRYNHIGEKSSNLMIKLKDAYIYDNSEGQTLVEMLDNLTIVDVLGEPDAGTLLEAMSYHDPATKEEPVLISELEDRTEIVMEEATLETLASWGIIDDTGFNESKWDNIKEYTIQEFLEYVMEHLIP